MKINWPITTFLYLVLSTIALAFTALTFGEFSLTSVLALASTEARIVLFLIIANFFATVFRRRRAYGAVIVWVLSIMLTAYEIVSLILFQLTRISITHNLSMLIAGGQGVRATLETVGKVTLLTVLIDVFAAIAVSWGLIYIIRFTERKIHQVKQVHIKPMVIWMSVLFAFVVAEQAVSYYFKKPSLWRVEQQNFPFYPNIIKPDLTRESNELEYKITLLPPVAPTTQGSSKAKNANVFLFIVESFAKRFVDAETTPNLVAFAKDSLKFRESVSNANGTHHSWYAILTSDYPMRFLEKTKAESWKGSPALRVLADNGFEIKIFDSAGFSYLNYDHIILGDKFSSTEIFTPPLLIQSQWDKTDVWANDLLIDHVSRLDKKARRLYISFPGATHFPYFSRHGENEQLEEPIDYFGILYSSAARETLDRRYRKAAQFFDEEFGRFIAALKSKGLYEDAIIIVTGDHGEELLEKKALGHGSSLRSEQIAVPLYIKVPGVKLSETADLVSQVDILPTVFEAVGLSNQKSLAQLAGQSRLEFQKKTFSFTSSVNRFRDNPNDFMITDGRNKVYFMIDLKPQDFKATTLTLVEITDMNDKAVPIMNQGAAAQRAFFENNFAPALEALEILKFN